MPQHIQTGQTLLSPERKVLPDSLIIRLAQTAAGKGPFP